MTKVTVWDEKEIKWIRESLTYCPETGQLHWKERFASNIPEDLTAGSYNTTGYLTINKVFDGKRRKFRLHRIAWFLHYGYQPKMLDHINQEKSDNRIINLRECEQKENLGNQKPRGNLGIKGVHKIPSGKYQVRCRNVYLGRFDDPIDAARAYDVEAIRVYGDFAYTNKEHGVY